MSDDYGIGATLGIVGAGVQLVALRGVIGAVQGNRGYRYKRGHAYPAKGLFHDPYIKSQRHRAYGRRY